MLHHQTFLRCSQRTAVITFIIIATLFILTGCAQLYKILGLTEQQTQNQLAEDQETIIRTITQVRTTAADIITTAIAGLGTITSGLLARLLGTERKFTKVLITSIEKAPNMNLKETITKEASLAGIQPKLHKRVKALT